MSSTSSTSRTTRVDQDRMRVRCRLGNTDLCRARTRDPVLRMASRRVASKSTCWPNSARAVRRDPSQGLTQRRRAITLGTSAHFATDPAMASPRASCSTRAPADILWLSGSGPLRSQRCGVEHRSLNNIAAALRDDDPTHVRRLLAGLRLGRDAPARRACSGTLQKLATAIASWARPPTCDRPEPSWTTRPWSVSARSPGTTPSPPREPGRA